MSKILTSVIAIVALLASPAPVSRAQWTHMPGPYGAHVGTMLVTGDKMFVASYYEAFSSNSGVFRSDDSGHTWKPANLGLSDSAVSCFAALGGKVFVGTSSSGIWLWNDLTQRWSPYGMAGVKITALGATRSSLLAGTPGGLYRLVHSDSVSWVRSDSGFTSFNVLTIGAFGDTVFVATKEGGTFRSLTGGADIWRQKIIPSGDVRAFELTDRGVLCAAGNGIYQSQDLGGTWKLLVPAPEGSGGFTCLAARGQRLVGGTFWRWYFGYALQDSLYTLVDSTSDPFVVNCFAASGSDLLMGADFGVLRSHDDGRSWESSSTGLSFGDVALCLNTGDTLWAASWGLWRSTDQGVSWIGQNAGLSDLFITSLASSASTMLVGTWSGGIFRSSDRGGHWVSGDSSLRSSGLITLAGFKKSFFAGVPGSGIFRSKDDGVSWQSLGLRHIDVTQFTYWDTLLFAGGNIHGSWPDSIFLSSDGGTTWRAMHYPEAATLMCLAATDRLILAGTWGSGLLSSSDHGDRWEATNLGGAGGVVTGITLLAGNVFCTTYNGVYLSTDGGSTWGPVSDGLPWMHSWSPVINGKYLYIGSEQHGVWRRPLADMVPTSVPGVDKNLPEQFALEQNYPNPFNPTTTIRYSLPHRSHVTLTVFNTLGQKVAELVNSDIDAGYHEVQFNAGNLASGIYYYRLQAGSYVDVKKLVLCK